MTKRSAAERRGLLFDRLIGAYARRHDDDGTIPCPLCLRRFDRQAATDADGALTTEHVPPDSVGGRVIVLTCKECNSWCGSAFDAELHAYHQFAAFMTGRPLKSEKLVVKVHHARLPARVEVRSDGITVMHGVPQAAPPGAVERFEDAIQQNTTDDGTFPIGFEFDRPFRPLACALGALKSAYLLCLHRLGWRYVLSPTFDLVRSELLKPTSGPAGLLAKLDVNAWPANPPVELLGGVPGQRFARIPSAGHVLLLPWPGDEVHDVATAVVASRSLPEIKVWRLDDGVPQYLLDVRDVTFD